MNASASHRDPSPTQFARCAHEPSPARGEGYCLVAFPSPLAGEGTRDSCASLGVRVRGQSRSIPRTGRAYASDDSAASIALTSFGAMNHALTAAASVTAATPSSRAAPEVSRAPKAMTASDPPSMRAA